MPPSTAASRDGSGKIHVSLCNLDPNRPATVACELRGAKPQRIAGRVLTAAEMTAHNTFEAPNRVQPVDFTGCQLTDAGFTATLPAKSVAVLELE